LPQTSALSFYFLVIGHVSRAWIMIGISIRLALTLGLHLRNEDVEAGDSRKETLVHTWWSLHSIDCLVSAISGRPPVIAFEDCTVPLPRSLPEELLDETATFGLGPRGRTDAPRAMGSSNTLEPTRRALGQSHYLLGHIRISIISQKALVDLYSPRTASKSWEVCVLLVLPRRLLKVVHRHRIHNPITSNVPTLSSASTS
jgi:hypothetical protein